MSNQRNVFAYTARNNDSPEFISINIETELKIATVIVRSPKELGGATAQATINLFEFQKLIEEMTQRCRTLIS